MRTDECKHDVSDIMLQSVYLETTKILNKTASESFKFTLNINKIKYMQTEEYTMGQKSY